MNDSRSNSSSSLAKSPVVSVAKKLANFTSIPSNRACADCRVTLIDSSQVHASYSPQLELVPPTRYNHFQINHARFAPPHANVPEALDPPMDPSLEASSRTGGHGVLVCGLCGAAHKLLGQSITLVHAVQDKSAWNSENVEFLVGRGGNRRARQVLEAYCPPSWNSKRPHANSSIADRLTFIRAKYQALAFLLPPAGPLATRAWRGIVNRHEKDWEWSVDLRSLGDLNLGTYYYESQHVSARNLFDKSAATVNRHAALPNRLVDYFCVVTPSNTQIDIPSDWDSVKRPEDLLLMPQVSDCYPSIDTYRDDMEFPAHVGTLVFPQGCRAVTSPLPPSFFTFVLTGGDGVRLYCGVLQLYDDTADVESLRNLICDSGYAGPLPEWLRAGSNNEDTDVVYLPKALIVMSHYPFFDLWRNFLLRIYRIALVEAPLPMERFIANFCREVPLPPPGKVQVKFGFSVKAIWNIERPPENQLPMADFSYQPLFSALSVGNILVVMGCLLQETSVAILSQHTAILTPVAEALVSLMFPFHWQGMYLPVCPYEMKDVLSAPVPFLVGLHAKYLVEVPEMDRPKTVLMVDLDKDIVHLGETETGEARDVPALPERQALKLRTKLEPICNSVYTDPEESRLPTGTLTTANGLVLPDVQRGSYARSFKRKKSSTTRRRRDLFGSVDKAYRDNELLVPIAGFFSEQGQFYERQASQSSLGSSGRAKKRFPTKSPTTKNKSLGSLSEDNESLRNVTSHSSAGILDIHGPTGFSTEAIRAAFLRFFVSLFRGYRSCLIAGDFRADDFLQGLNLPATQSAFVRCMLNTQFFARFLNERKEIPDDPEIRFFDESINAKLNRSKKSALTQIGRGGKRPTDFLDDTSTKVQDTFTPPPPSNWGLPDDGKTYHYGSFPKLDPALFGKVREPMEWPTYNRRSSLRMSRRASGLVQTSERAFFAKNMSPPGAKQIVKATKRGVRGLESALGALSSPFVGRKISQDSDDQSDVYGTRRMSDVTLPSTLDLQKDDISTAEEVVLNARRKQAILVGIIIKLQSFCRAYLARQRLRKSLLVAGNSSISSFNESRRLEAAGVLYKWVSRTLPCYLERKRFLSTRRAVISIQTRARASIVKDCYTLLRSCIVYVQAISRGILTRRLVATAVNSTFPVYRKQIFDCWRRAQVPLTYRTTFWPLLKQEDSGILEFSKLALAQAELVRLWGELNISHQKQMSVPPALDLADTLFIMTKLGMDTRTFENCTTPSGMVIEEKASTTEAPRRRSMVKRTSSRTMTGTRDEFLTWEKSQVYDTLSQPGRVKNADLLALFDKFGVATERQKKAALADTLWQDIVHVEASIALLCELFPEIYTRGIILSSPSKKAARRFRLTTGGVIPSPPPSHELLGSVLLDKKVRENNAQIARLGLSRIPDISAKIAKAEERLRVHRRFLSVGDRRAKSMKQLLWYGCVTARSAENTGAKPENLPGDKTVE